MTTSNAASDDNFFNITFPVSVVRPQDIHLFQKIIKLQSLKDIRMQIGTSILYWRMQYMYL